MLLSAGQVRQAILHSDRIIREAAVYYFGWSLTSDTFIVRLVKQAIERYGVDNAFEFYVFLGDLPLDEDTVEWAIEEVRRIGDPQTSVEEELHSGLLSAIKESNPVLLKRHADAILGVEHLHEEMREAIGQRIWLAARDPEQLWRDLQRLCNEGEGDEYPTVQQLETGYAIAAALATHRDRYADRLLSDLRDECRHGREYLSTWMQVFLIRLAGEMRLEEALPWIVDSLMQDDELLHEDCMRALTRIGTERTVEELARRFPNAKWSPRHAIASTMENIRSDKAAVKCLEFAEQSAHVELQARFLEAALRNYATSAIAPARRFVIHTPRTPEVLDVRRELLTACEIMRVDFPERESWLEDSKYDEEFREQWEEEHLEEFLEEGDWDDEFAYVDEEEFED